MILSFEIYKKRAFTLIEMIAVVAIVGILAAALVPRIGTIRAKAHDIERKKELQEITTALINYKMSHGNFPPGAGPLEVISGALASVGMTNIPKDPVPNRSFRSIGGDNEGKITITDGQYGYVSMAKNGIPNTAFILMAATETEGGSNRVENRGDGTKYCDCIWQSGPIKTYLPYICTSFTLDPLYDHRATGAKAFSNGVCKYASPSELRLVYMHDQ